MGKHTQITSICAVPTGKTCLSSDRGPIRDQIVVGTPGTIKKWMSKNRFNARNVKMLVFDEADHMLAEDGFKDDSERIVKTLRSSCALCQVLLFSATFNDTVKNFVSKMIKDGNQMFVKKEELSLESVKQFKRSARLLHQALDSEGGWKCTNIHGDYDTAKRDEIVKEFKDGLTKPHNEVYLHRCGRAGRFGRKGAVLNLLCTDPATGIDSIMLMEKIERHFGIHVSQVPDYQSDEDISAALKEAGLL
ncbi:hypothetical protein MKW94_015835 [Papaver nudicaule]|uniref:Helicase ATP-binding domain-containing protein n=1 Tax=Papaver nudicaule TaxID=74823 RepID=A0AA41UXA0_PAPNU|nr:hypothetical protein [Papaver nudicaule]